MIAKYEKKDRAFLYLRDGGVFLFFLCVCDVDVCERESIVVFMCSAFLFFLKLKKYRCSPRKAYFFKPDIF